MGEKKVKEVKEHIKGQVSAFEDKIKLRQTKEGGMTLKDALFKAAFVGGARGNTDTDQQNQNMKINKMLVGNIQEQEDEEDSTNADTDKKALNEDDIILQQDDNQN